MISGTYIQTLSRANHELEPYTLWQPTCLCPSPVSKVAVRDELVRTKGDITAAKTLQVPCVQVPKNVETGLVELHCVEIHLKCFLNIPES